MITTIRYEAPELALQALEQELDLFITVVDFKGLFHIQPGKAILSLKRQSHKKIPVCKIGFCNKKCIAHCRNQMNTECQKRTTPFASNCWKGLKQIVVPLRFNGRHCGMLYAGCWKSNIKSPPKISKKFQDAYRELKDFPNKRADNIMNILNFFSQGLMVSLNEYGALPQKNENTTMTRKDRIEAFIHNHATETIQLTDLAQFLELSNSRTSVLVNSLFGKSFITLLTEERIVRAKILLLSSEFKIKEIARNIGFNDEYHFNRIFHKHIGLPPGKFRHQCKR